MPLCTGKYEIFEVLQNGSVRRVAVVSGFEFAKVTLHELAKRTLNECFAAEAKTRQVVAQLNVPPGGVASE
jgi:hypothetical protein